ncbi:MAG: LPXTG cell wall anchor domain-containing protein [Lachnospiraceae bacterium]|nr:LPXTG cell wall anchor domain-containing protein [Lachnospiraceae bacterium]
MNVYPVADINGNMLGPVTTGTDGTYAFEELAAGTYYVVFKDSSGSYYVVGSGSTEAPIDFSDLSVTTDMSALSNSVAVNQSQADYDGTDTAAASGGAADLAQAVITNETGNTSGSGIELPKDVTGSSTYITSNWNAGFCYIELDMKKVWENIIGGIETGKEVTFEVTGTTGSGALTVVDDKYTLKQGSTSTNVSVSKNSTTVTSPTVKVTDSAANGISTVTWELGTVALKAKGSSGRISYTITEAAINGFVTNVKTTSDSASELSVTATNTQVLYELELYKITTSSSGQTTTESYLSNAEFTLYTDSTCETVVTAITGSASATSGASAASGSGTISTTDTSVGKLYIGQLAAGTYYLKETKAPSGYELNKSIWKIDISYVASDPTTPVISVTLVQKEDGTPIAESDQKKYDLTSASTVPSASTTGGTDTVYVTSTKSGSATGSTDPDTLYTLSFKMNNEIIYSLPQTGSIGIIWPTLAGVALMLAALAMNERKRWKAYA